MVLSLEIIFFIMLIMNAILFIPQAKQLVRTKDASTTSLTMFFVFNIIQIFCIIHAVIQADYLLAFGTLLSFLTCGAVTVLIMQYRIKLFKSCIYSFFQYQGGRLLDEIDA